MTKKSRNRFLLVVGTIVGLSLIGGNLGVKALERLMIYYLTNDHDFATPENPIKPMDIYWMSDDGVKTHGWFLENPSVFKGLGLFPRQCGKHRRKIPLGTSTDECRGSVCCDGGIPGYGYRVSQVKTEEFTGMLKRSGNGW